jgi:signal transduction histidine kinase
MSHEGTANRRSYRIGVRNWRGRPARHRWSPLAMKAETVRALPVVVPVTIVGAIAIVAAIVQLAVEPPGLGVLAGVAGLLVAATVAEAFPLPIEGVNAGATSLAIVSIVATAVIYGWAEAAVVGFLTMALVEFVHKRTLVRVIFNTAMYVCAAVLAGLAAALVQGGDLGSIVFGACLGSAAFYLVDMVFLSAVVARTRHTSFIQSLGRYVYSTTLPFLVMASLIVTLIVLWDRSPFISVVVLGPLVTVALHERWLHRALERLREFDRLKDEFIAVISHELRTPLTSVYGAALTLQKRDVSEDMQSALLDIVSDEAGRLARLLDDALSASRLHADRETFDIAPIDGPDVARSIVEAARPRLPEGLTIELIAPDELPLVAADPDKLRQVLVNLTENAIKYSPDGGRIQVLVDREGPAMRFSVRDRGIGIAPAEQSRIFERFHRLDPNMTRGVGGTGLGLYICRELVQRMGGRIWVTSREGDGSTFSFDLPLA